MNQTEFTARLKDLADNYKTAYVQCCFGAPMTEANKKRYAEASSYNKKHAEEIKKLTSDIFGFDCICMIKGILWGWSGNKKATYGGAKYCSNGVPDIGTEQMLEKCSEVSTNFNTIQEGEYVWMQGHCGIYIGDGYVIECTPKWDGGVQYSKLGNVVQYASGKYRCWTKHGKLPYIEYPQNANVYRVKRGDTLWSIAQRYYGDGSKWPLIAQANNLKGSDIYAGQTLLLKG